MMTNANVPTSVAATTPKYSVAGRLRGGEATDQMSMIPKHTVQNATIPMAPATIINLPNLGRIRARPSGGDCGAA